MKKLRDAWNDEYKRDKLMQNQGKRMAYGLVLVFTIVLIMIYVQHTNEIEDQSITVEEILEVVDSGQEYRIRELAQELGWTVDEVKDIAASLKEEIAHMKALEERQKTLGTWQDAMKNGVLLSSAFDNRRALIEEYWDVNDDGKCDFAVYYDLSGYDPDHEPDYWRYCDLDGKPYG